MRYAAVLLILIACSAPVSGQDELFRDANEQYRRMQYDSAAQSYERIIGSGTVSYEAYYNLGNAYFRLKRIPDAILNYHKALKISPRKEDAEFNLELANLMVADKIVPLPKLFYQRWWEAIGNSLSADGWAGVSLAFSWIFLLSGVLYFLLRQTGLRILFFSLALTSVLISGSCYFMAKGKAPAASHEKEAIIFEPSVYVKSSPDDKAVDLFILHEGVHIRITDAIGEWKRIRIANGNEGWVREGVYRTISLP